MVKNISACFLLCLFSMTPKAYAQVFWSEDFSDGFPTDWTTVDESNQGALWTFCNNPFDDIASNVNCPVIWHEAPNEQAHFQSSTSQNGFVVLNSDYYRLDPNYGYANHKSGLMTSKIDCSDAPTVYLEFQSHIGVFILPAESNAIVQVSTDGNNWSNFEAFPYLIPSGTTDPGFLRWSKNPQKTYIDISSVAALQEEVFIRWYWIGSWELYWALDDVKLSINDPRPAIDLSLKYRGNYTAIPPNHKIPISQLEPMHFMTDVANLGYLDLLNVDLSLTITESQTGQIVYEEHILIDRLKSNEKINEQLFPVFNEKLNIGAYNIEYKVGDISKDEVPEDNIFSSTFWVTESEFHKDNGEINIQCLSLGPQEFSFSQLMNWSVGNYFYFPSGTNYLLKSISFSLPKQKNIQGITFNPIGHKINVNLYSWRDTNGDGDAQDLEYQKLASGEYRMINSEEEIQLKLMNVSDPDKPVSLQNNTAYLAMLEYKTTEALKSLAVNGSSKLEYLGMEIATYSRNLPRYSSYIKKGEETTFRFGGFGSDVTPIIRLEIEKDKIISTNRPKPVQALFVSPNPADKKINFSVPKNKIYKPSKFELIDAFGNVVLKAKSQSPQIELNIADLAAGIYYLKVSNDLDQYIQKVIVH